MLVRSTHLGLGWARKGGQQGQGKAFLMSTSMENPYIPCACPFSLLT